MNVRELRRAIRQAPYVFVWTTLEPEEGAYVQVTKAAILLVLRDMDSKAETNGEIRNGNEVYIN